MDSQYVMPLTNVRLVGSSFAVPNNTDCYWVFVPPEELGRPDARGLGDAARRNVPTVDALLRILQSLIAFSKDIVSIRVNESISPAIVGATRVHCTKGQGVLFVIIINSPYSVTRLQTLRDLPSASYVAEGGGAAIDDAVGEDFGPAAAGKRRRGDGSINTKRQARPFNMADWISINPSDFAMDRSLKRGPGVRPGPRMPQRIEITDTHIRLLAVRAFPDGNLSVRIDSSGLCTRAFQLQDTPFSLSRILGLEATIRLLRESGADDHFLERANYEGDPGALNLHEVLGFRSLELSRCDVERIPGWVFPWSYVPTQGVVSRIDEIILEAQRGQRVMDPAVKNAPGNAQHEWALRELLASATVVASEGSFDFYSLRTNARAATSTTRSRVHALLASEAGAEPATIQRRMENYTYAMRAHHECLRNDFYRQIEQLLDPLTRTIPSIAAYSTVFQEWCTSVETPHPRDHNHRFVATVATGRPFSNVSHFQSHILIFMDQLDVMGLNTTHSLGFMVDCAAASVGLMTRLRTNMTITGDPSSGKSMTVSMIMRFYPEGTTRTAAFVTAKADHVPGSDYMICVSHEVNNNDKTGEGAVMKKQILDSDNGKRITVQKNEQTGKWEQVSDPLPRNLVFLDCSNAQATQIDPALATRYHNVETVESQRKDMAIPRVGNSDLAEVNVELVRCRRVQTSRRMVMMTIGETLGATAGTVALRFLNLALEKVAESSSVQTVLDKFRGALRLWNTAQVVMYSRVGSLLFDFPESPFYQRPFGFLDLVSVVLHCCFVDISDLVFAATLCEENGDDATMVALRQAILTTFFQGRPTGRVSHDEGAAAGAMEEEEHPDMKRDNGRDPYEGFYIRIETADKNIEPDPERLASPIPDAPNAAGINMADLTAEIARAHDEEKNHSIKEYGIRSRKSRPAGRNVHGNEELELNIDAMIRHLRRRCPRILAGFSDDALRRRVWQCYHQHDTPAVGEGDERAPRRVRRLDFISGNVVASKTWLFSGAMPGLAAQILSLMSYDHAPPSEWFVTAYQDLSKPQQYLMREVVRDPAHSLVLPPQLNISKTMMERLNRTHGGIVNMNNDNWLLTQRLAVVTDLHTAALNDHMMMNGFSRESYVVGEGDYKVDFFKAVDFKYWARLKPHPDLKTYPPPVEPYNCGQGELDTSALQEAFRNVDRRALPERTRSLLEAIMDSRTRTLSDPLLERRPSSASAAAGDDSMPPPPRPLMARGISGPSDFGHMYAAHNIPVAARISPRHPPPRTPPMGRHSRGASSSSDSGARASNERTPPPPVSSNVSRLLGDDEF